MASANGDWYVFYTHPNAEKVVLNELMKRHYEAFLPMFKTLRQWKNRQKKLVSTVLFPGYIFVRTAEYEIFNIVQIPQVVRCVKCGDRYSVVPDRDIRCIEQMISLKPEIIKECDFSDGEHVRVKYGPLAGYEGLLITRKGKNRFGIVFDDIHQCACIDIDASMLEKI